MTSPSLARGTDSASAPPAPVSVAAEIPDHRGQPRDASRELFGMPPVEIGRVVSVESTLKAGGWAHPAWMRWVVMALVGALAAAVILVAFDARHMTHQDRDSAVILACFAAAMAAGATWYFTRNVFGPRCSYVGDDGVALFHLRRGRSAPPTAQVLVFAQAAELRASQTRQFINGVYQGTDYDYRWTDAGGRQLLRLSGRYNGKDKPPKPLDPFHFAEAADVAWSNHFLDRALAQLQKEGSVAFRVDVRRVVRVGPGFMEFHFGGEPVRVTKDEIAKVTLGGGHFAFTHKDARWFSRAGKFNFDYGKMANGKVFFLVLDRLMGYRWA
jgi:hypothetical protein